MDFKKLILPFFLLMVVASASATVTVSVTVPASGQAFQPNLRDADKCFTLDFNVLDDNEDAPIHIANVYYNYGDSNTFLMRDVNLDTGECTFVTDHAWGAAGGALCTLDYCWSTHNPVTGDYVLDVNVLSTDPGKETIVGGQGIVIFSLDNRYITASVEALIGVIPIVLVAAILILATLGLMGVVSPKTVIIMLPGLIIVLIALIIISALTATMTAQV